jgi:hypothetical protein
VSVLDADTPKKKKKGKEKIRKEEKRALWIVGKGTMA